MENEEHNKIIKSAEQGRAIGQYNLGMMYEFGQGVSQNYEEAVKWYTLAAEQGLAEAQFSLGDIFVNGEVAKKIMSWPMTGIF